jgi:hypothetical protein
VGSDQPVLAEADWAEPRSMRLAVRLIKSLFSSAIILLSCPCSKTCVRMYSSAQEGRIEAQATR